MAFFSKLLKLLRRCLYVLKGKNEAENCVVFFETPANIFKVTKR